ncbi:MAG: ACT domain-containing protein [Tissierellales bacterium]|jgi:ACT domain-containing protein|nr:ACT domain-containing protein [Tissierellales bacterium]HCX04116.1 ACT domain-containing protein [Clostridiales bacterium]
MRSVVTIIGKDKVGIIANVAGVLAENNANILDINQTVMQEYFTMIMLVDVSEISIDLVDLKHKLEKIGKEMGLSVRLQREDIFNKMHEI